MALTSFLRAQQESLFFFQAEDGIRDLTVTGVQTCALPICIPTAVKTRNGVLKHILKKAVRGVIPDELIDRKKQGFGVPVYEWHHTRFGEYVAKEMEEFCKNTDLFHFKGASPFLKKRGWALLNVALWWKQYIGSPATTRSSAGQVTFQSQAVDQHLPLAV